MPNEARKSPIKFIAATVIILGTIAYLSFSGGRDNKSYYVTIGELQGMGNKAYVRHLRVAGNVAPGSIHRVGTNATFDLLEQGRKLSVVYQGSEPPPDTFKDDAVERRPSSISAIGAGAADLDVGGGLRVGAGADRVLVIIEDG